MKNEDVLEYKIRGVDKRKEVLIASPLCILVLLIAAGLLYAYVGVKGLNTRHLGVSHIIVVAVLSASLTFLVFKFLKDYWLIKLNTAMFFSIHSIYF